MSKSGKKQQPHKKKLRLSSSPPCGLASLPTEIALSCLARVSRSDYASLSMVSKSHHSLMLSPELYDIRSQMGFTENCVFLCLSIPSDPFVRWFAFTLNHRPGRPVPIRPHLYQPPELSSVVALGCGIYIIGGRIGGRPSSRVFFLDCRSHTWTNLPSMGVAREFAAAGLVDGKIYVFGGCEDWNSRRWGEVFDPKTQTWDALPMPLDQYSLRLPLIYESAAIEDKIFAADTSCGGLFYIPSEGKWQRANTDLSGAKKGWYVIENVMYCCGFGESILWCEASELECRELEVMEWRREPQVIKWREVMGLEALRGTLSASRLVHYGVAKSDHARGLLPEELDHVFPGYKLSNSGPNMLLFWDVLAPEKLEIWCAEISLERRKETGEIWGNIEWSEAVMTLDPPPPHRHRCKILYSLSLNL